MKSQPLEHRIWIHAPIAEVWRAWTDAESIAQWFAQVVRVEPWEGGAFELSFEPESPERHSTRGCRLLEFL
ncbi:MAG: SRPBCC domain-containing protein, partial [Candidatus Eisenbacteria bacterium]|nr:SRPBCC domain-containing protein [Candidatus Eisenbacteria bacterium]